MEPCSSTNMLFSKFQRNHFWQEASCPLGTTRCIQHEKFPRKPYNKSFIDQVCSVKMAGYLPRSLFCEFMDLEFVSVHKLAKKGLGQYPAILTEQTWSITHTYCIERLLHEGRHCLLIFDGPFLSSEKFIFGTVNIYYPINCFRLSSRQQGPWFLWAAPKLTTPGSWRLSCFICIEI